MKSKQHLGPSLCEALNIALADAKQPDGWHRLPDGTDILIGTEWIYASTDRKPNPCPVDIGGEIPLVLWK